MGWFTGAGLRQAERRSVRAAWFLDLALQGGAQRLWTGFGPITTDGKTYRGMGALTSLPALQQLINGQAARATFGMSGVDARCAPLASAERDTVFGRKITVALGILDEDQQLIAAPFVLWKGRMETVIASTTGGDGSSSATATVGVEAVTLFAGRRRSNTVLLSDRQQNRRSEGDRFCERTDRYRFSNKPWP